MNSFVLYGLILVLISSASCITRGQTNFEGGLRLSNELYVDLSNQVTYALNNNSVDTKKTEKLKLINQKLEEYRIEYYSFLQTLHRWETSGKKPENTMELYKELWNSILEAQTLAGTSYIYASECSARLALKGKAGNNCP